MTTKLEKPIKREVMVDGVPHTVTIDPNSIKVVEKGRRNGKVISYSDIKAGHTAIDG